VKDAIITRFAVYSDGGMDMTAAYKKMQQKIRSKRWSRFHHARRELP